MWRGRFPTTAPLPYESSQPDESGLYVERFADGGVTLRFPPEPSRTAREAFAGLAIAAFIGLGVVSFWAIVGFPSMRAFARRFVGLRALCVLAVVGAAWAGSIYLSWRRRRMWTVVSVTPDALHVVNPRWLLPWRNYRRGRVRTVSLARSIGAWDAESPDMLQIELYDGRPVELCRGQDEQFLRDVADVLNAALRSGIPTAQQTR